MSQADRSNAEFNRLFEQYSKSLMKSFLKLLNRRMGILKRL